MRMRASPSAWWRRSSCRMRRSSPTRVTETPRALTAATVPSTSACGDCSLPMASIATRRRLEGAEVMRGEELLRGFFGLLGHDLTVVVVAAALAHAVRQLGLLAARARDRVRDLDRTHPLRTPRVAPAPGEFSLGNRHFPSAFL